LKRPTKKTEKLVAKTCLYCGKRFKTPNKDRKFCELSCSTNAIREHNQGVNEKRRKLKQERDKDRLRREKIRREGRYDNPETQATWMGE
jgi:hypothetical protein